MIGDSKEESTDPDRPDAGRQRHRGRARACACSRCWPASMSCAPGARIRVMTQDGFPIYDQSETHPGAFVVVLPFRRDARGQSRAHHRADDRPRRARHSRWSRLQRAEVPCSGGCLRRGATRRASPSTASAMQARAGDTVAAALLAAGIDHCRTTPVTRRAARALLPDGRVLRLPGHHRRRRQPPGLPGRRCARACASRRSAASARPDDDATASDLARSYDVVVDRRGPGRACRGGASGARRACDRAARRESRRSAARSIAASPRRPSPTRSILGEDYWAGERARGRGQGERRAIVQRRHGVEPRPAARSSASRSRGAGAPDRGAARHPRHRRAGAAVPDSRLDAARRDDGRRRADAAQGARASCRDGRTVMAGTRPAALAAGGADPARRRHASRRSSTRRRARNWLRALPHLPDFVLSPYFAKGLALLREVRAQGARRRGVDTPRGRGRATRLARSCFGQGRRASSGIAGRSPAAAPGRGAQRQSRHRRRRRARWDDAPALLRAGARRGFRHSSVPGIAVAGDGAGIAGAHGGGRARAASPAIAAVRGARSPSASRACPIARALRQALQRERDGPRLPRPALPAGRRVPPCPRATPSSAAARR